MNTEAPMEHPFKSIVTQWLSKLKIAKKVKDERFGKAAAEAMKFYAGNHDFMWSEEYASGSGGFLSKNSMAAMPTFRMTVNKPFEAVALFGPALYMRNPTVQVSPLLPPSIPDEALGIDPNDPYMAQQLMVMNQQESIQGAMRSADSSVMSCYLNWLIQEQDLKVASRRTITESIIKGMGLLWIEMFTNRSGDFTYPRAVHVSVDDFLQDPDAEYVEDVQWIARRCCHPVNLVERKYGLKPGDLKGHLQSYAAQGNMDQRDKERLKRQKQGQSYDLIEYYEIYSKNGFGDRLKGNNAEKSKYNFESFGDNCYLAVAHGIPFPLNMPSWSLAEGPEQMFMRSQWPLPMWVDEGCGNGWPCTRLTFYEKPKDVWPMGLFHACIGELRFVNWCMSFLADKVAASSTTYIAQAKAAGVEIQTQLKGGLAPYTVLEISEMMGKSINDVVSFLQAPNFSVDVWNMVSQVMNMIDKRTGLTELLYGITSSQMRSAKEAEVKDQNISVRPDDMAGRVEDWMSETTMKLAEAALWNVDPQATGAVLGQKGAMVWNRMQTTGIDQVVRNYSFRIEAGSTRKPNKENRVRQLQELGQVALPVMQQFAMSGVPGPWNAYMQESAKAMDMDATPFLVEPPPPPDPNQPTPEQQAAQLEMQKTQMQMESEQAKTQMQLQAEQMKMQMDGMKGQQDMLHDHAVHKQEMNQLKQRANIDIKVAKDKAKAQSQVAKIKVANARKPAGVN